MSEQPRVWDAEVPADGVRDISFAKHYDCPERSGKRSCPAFVDIYDIYRRSYTRLSEAHFSVNNQETSSICSKHTLAHSSVQPVIICVPV